MLVVGLAGASCSGKTSVARCLASLLPRTKVLHQDYYYKKEADPGHVRHQPSNCIDWEVLEAFHMDRMVQDAENALKLPLREVSSLPEIPCTPSLPPSVRAQLEEVRHLPLLVVEGICVLNDPRLADLCQLKFFLELDEQQMKKRRELRGNWGEEGEDTEEECWSESPEYFHDVAWPGYLSIVEGLRNQEGIIFLDSGTRSVEQQLYYVLNCVLSHLQVHLADS